MKAVEFAIVALVLVCAGLAVTFYLTDSVKSGAVAVPQEFEAKSGVVEPAPLGETRGGEGSSLAGRAYDSALLSLEKTVLSPQEPKKSVSGLALLFVALVVVACVAVWVRSR